MGRPGRVPGCTLTGTVGRGATSTEFLTRFGIALQQTTTGAWRRMRICSFAAVRHHGRNPTKRGSIPLGTRTHSSP